MTKRLFVTLLFVPLFANAGYNEQELQTKAEIEGYGYKSANLMLLRDVLKDSTLRRSIAPYDVQVPDFVAVSSAEIQALLASQSLSIPLRWQRVLASTVEASSQSLLIAKRSLPQAFLDASNLLSQDIEAAFVRLSESPVKHEGLRRFLEKAIKAKWRLMARSTGKEDTDKLANAGGNLSVANLPANAKEVLIAMGQVVASYFKERSLMQRIGAGDDTLFELPLTPVLVQRMIGEVLGGEKDAEKIPVGCVLYTEESAGRLPGVHTFQCAFGHNEGVVQSLVPLDTYYVSKSSKIRSIIKDKNARIVPVLENGVFGLETRNNPSVLHKRSALSKGAALATFKVSEAIDSFYGKRMDIEMVYEPSSHTIHIVQARPLVIPEPGESGPSYMVQASRFLAKEVVLADTINPVDSGVQRVQHPQEAIVADTLELALKSYTNPDRDRQLVKVILVTREVDATSHAAAVFRGDSKAILQVKELAKLQSWLSQPSVDFMVDAQRGLLVDITKHELAQQSLQELFKERVLKRGWLNYPLPLRVSVEAHQPQYCLAPQLRAERIFDKMTCLIERLEDEVDELGRWTESIRTQLQCDHPECLGNQIIASQSLPKLEHLNTLADELTQEVVSKSQDKNLLMALFPKRFLEALVYQEPESRFAESYSYKSVKQDYEQGRHFVQNYLEPMIASKRISQVALKNAELFSLAQRGTEAALIDEVAQRWIAFVDTVYKGDAASQKRLSSMIDQLEALGVLPLWINSIFANESKGESLYTSFDQSRPFLERALAVKNRLTAYDLGVWNDPSRFAKNKEQFEQNFMDYFLSDAFLIRKTKLEELAALGLMGQFVDTFDWSIKALKGSSQYRESEQKVEHFKVRLEDYFRVLDRWAKAMPENLLAYHSNWSRELYLSTVLDQLAQISNTAESELFPSPGFSVAAAALGSATAFERHLPERLEDIFTLIHQSLNRVTGAQMQKALVGQLQTPKRFDELYRELLKMQVEGVSTLLTGIALSKEGLVFDFNVPLRNHSARLALSFDKATQALALKMEFLGQARNRWSLIKDHVELWSLARDLTLDNVSIGPLELLYTILHVEKVPLGEIKDLVSDSCMAANSQRLPQGAMGRAVGNISLQQMAQLPIRLRLNIHAEFINDGRYDEGAISAAQKGMTDADRYVRNAALKLLLALVEKGQGYEAAISAAQKGMTDAIGSVRNAALELLRALIAKDQGYEAAIFAAQKGVTDGYLGVRNTALGLFLALVEKGQGYEAAISAAQKGMTDASYDIRNTALDLFRALFAKGQGFEEAQAIIDEGGPSTYDLKQLLLLFGSK